MLKIRSLPLVTPGIGPHHLFYGQDQSQSRNTFWRPLVGPWRPGTIKLPPRIMLRMTLATANKRLLPRFTLRGLLAAVTIMAIGFAWHARVARQRHLVAALAKSNPSVRLVYDDERSEVNFAVGWLRDWLGRDYVANAVAVELFYPTDDDLGIVAALPALEELRLQRAVDLTADGIAQLVRIPSLKSLVVSDGWNLDDAAMQEFARVDGLDEFTLEVGPRVSASGVIKLAALTKLKRLRLTCANDQAAQAVNTLQAQLPNCQINERTSVEVL